MGPDKDVIQFNLRPGGDTHSAVFVHFQPHERHGVENNCIHWINMIVPTP